MKCPLSLLLCMTSVVFVYDVLLLLSMTYHFQSRLGKNDCMDLWVIKLTNQVSPSSGFPVPHCFNLIILIQLPGSSVGSDGLAKFLSNNKK